jgi:di/tricarboxylate transporter
MLLYFVLSTTQQKFEIYIFFFRKEVNRRSAEIKRLSKVFALGVAYASNSGGIATLVGTPPNIILQGVANEYVFTVT